MRHLDILRGMYVKSPHWMRRAAGRVLAILPVEYRYGGTYRHFRNDILRSETDAVFVGELQLKQLRHLIAICWESSPYYRSMFEQVFGCRPDPQSFTFNDFMKLPILKKSDVREAPERFLAKSLSEVDVVSTSGSSGRPLKFFLDRNRGVKELAFIHHIWRRCGYRLHHRRAVLRGVHLPNVDVKPWEFDPALNELRLSPFHLVTDIMDTYLRLIMKYDVNFIHGYPSAISILANHAKRIGWTPPKSLIGILPISESLFTHQRDLIHDAFGRVSVLQFYGLSEKVAIAGELPNQSDIFEFEPLYGHTELLDSAGRAVSRPGETGRIIATGFVNDAMPLLRYDTGDTAELLSLPSSENCYRLRLRGIRSRWGQEFIVGSDGALISIAAINIHSPIYARIKEFQFYQYTPGVAIIRVVPIPGHSYMDIIPFVDEIQKKVGTNVRVSLEMCDEIAPNKRGKRSFIDQRLDLLPYVS